MNTGATHFKSGNNVAKAKAGKKHRLTVLREKLGVKNIEDLKEDVLNVWLELYKFASNNSKLSGNKRKQ